MTEQVRGAQPAGEVRQQAWAAVATVGIGGACGTLARAEVARLLPHNALALPVGTLLVNLVGAGLLGFLLGRLALSPDRGWRRTLRLGLGTGFCGGLTTYSTFMIEVARLNESGNSSALTTGIAYWIGSLIAGIALATGGLWLARKLPTPSRAAQNGPQTNGSRAARKGQA